jgi:hypothetical protein
MHLANEHQEHDRSLSFKKRGTPKYFGNLNGTESRADATLALAKLNIQLSPNLDR